VHSTDYDHKDYQKRGYVYNMANMHDYFS